LALLQKGQLDSAIAYYFNQVLSINPDHT